VYNGTISDLEELILQCRTQESKDYISEAYAAYKASAYRSCIVTTWIALVFDIIDKIRELSIAGDNKAKTILEKFEKLQERVEKNDPNALKDSLTFEREILDVAKNDLSLIDSHQFTDLDRLKEDRNRCAHPTFQRIETPYHPTPEQARYHLKNAITHVLQMPPVQGKQALSNLLKLVESEYFPQDYDDALKQLQASDLSRPTKSLINAFVDNLLHSYFDNKHPLYFQKRALVALQCCVHMFREDAIPRLIKQFKKIVTNIDDEQLTLAVGVTFFIPEMWLDVGEAVQIRIREYIARCDAPKFVMMAGRCLQNDDLAPLIKDRIQQLECADLSKLISHGVTDECVERAVELFCSSRNWHEANRIYADCVFPVFEKLTEAHLTRIIKSHEEESSDLPGSTGFSNFLDELIKTEKLSKEQLIDLLKENNLEHFALYHVDDDDTEESEKSESETPF